MPDSSSKLPDPTGHNVIILSGKFAGQEGFCLGTAGEVGVFAVSPHSSNSIRRLRFDEELGILINTARDRAGQN